MDTLITIGMPVTFFSCLLIGIRYLNIGVQILREGRTPDGPYNWDGLTGARARSVGRMTIYIGIGFLATSLLCLIGMIQKLLQVL